MPWLPSHTELRDHPKTLRAARALGIPRVHLIGHLHLLWGWAMSYAPTGDLSEFDPEDIAAAAEWDGPPEAFIDALIGGRSGAMSPRGFIDAEVDESCTTTSRYTKLTLHDWQDYAGAFATARAEDGVRGNHVRWHEKRGVADPDCPLCSPPDRPPMTPRSPPDIGANRPPIARREEKRREEKKTRSGSTPTSTDVDIAVDPGPEFALFWHGYPMRNGKREGKAKGAAVWARMSPADRELAMVGAGHYAAACAAGLSKAADAFRWLRDRRWTDWQTPATPDPRPMSARDARLNQLVAEAAATLPPRRDSDAIDVAELGDGA